LRYLGPSTSVEAAIRDLEHESAEVRVRAAEALGLAKEEERERASAALRRHLGDESPDVRYMTALSTGRLKDRQAVAELVQLMLEDPEPMPRQAAAVALGQIGDARATEPLVQALSSSSPDLRFQAVNALPQVDPARAVAPLTEALRDADPEVRASAAAALGDLGGQGAGDALAKAMADDAEPRVRQEAALALARVGDRRATPVLVALLDHPDLGIHAAEGLYHCPDSAAAPALRRTVERWLAPAVAKVWAAGALVRLGENWAQERLLALLSKRNDMVRGLTIQVLGDIDQPWSRNALKSLIEPPVARQWQAWQEEIVQALGRSGRARG
jgi:HEAT repeat protein